MYKIITKLQITYFVLIIVCAALLMAWVSEYAFGLLPCNLCLYQRYLYIAAAMVLAVHLFVFNGHYANWFLFLTGLILVACAGVAMYQVAVEQHWVELPKTCVSDVSADSFEAFKQHLKSKEVIPCDEIQFSLFGISMAGYNVLLSVFLGIVSILGIGAYDKRNKKFTRR